MNESDEIKKIDLMQDYTKTAHGWDLSPEQRRLLRDEIVPMTEEDRKFVESRIRGPGCFIPAVAAVAAAVFCVFFFHRLFTGLMFGGVALFLAAIFFILPWRLNRSVRRRLAENKKRVIVTTVEKTKEEDINGTRFFYAILNVHPKNFKVDIKEKFYKNLKPGTLVEMHVTTDAPPEGQIYDVILRGLTKVKNTAPEEKADES